ncbi:HNH endonuclease [Mesorhizobium sp. M6A.T.Ca.TU.002.02.2.1]|nr:HNH endonuclease [Mesorhizobium sp. M6A.T.Ca.TU.002.02.2.1]
MQTWREDVEDAVRSIGGQGSLDQIYEAVQSLSARPLPPSWRAIVRRELEYNSSDSESYQRRFDLFFSVRGIGAGIWGLRASEEATPQGSDTEASDRVETLIYRVLRDTAMARRVKKLHNDRCQICGTVLKLRDGKTYSEAHHIRPLGLPHSGPDVPANILVLCPNHHALLDYGAMSLNEAEVAAMKGHRVEQEFIDYHNREIAGLKASQVRLEPECPAPAV